MEKVAPGLALGWHLDSLGLVSFEGYRYSYSSETPLIYFTHVRANNAVPVEHEHDCAVCGDTFTCEQLLCRTGLSRYYDKCLALEVGSLVSDKAINFDATSSTLARSSSRVEDSSCVDGSLISVESQPRSKNRIYGLGISMTVSASL